MIKSNCTGKARTTDLNCLLLRYCFSYWPINSFTQYLRRRFHSFFFYSTVIPLSFLFGKNHDSICEVATSVFFFWFSSHNLFRQRKLFFVCCSDVCIWCHVRVALIDWIWWRHRNLKDILFTSNTFLFTWNTRWRSHVCSLPHVLHSMPHSRFWCLFSYFISFFMVNKKAESKTPCTANMTRLPNNQITKKYKIRLTQSNKEHNATTREHKERMWVDIQSKKK